MLVFVFPAVGFVALLSLLPHKELRFIFAVIPVLNMSAALGMAKWARAWEGGRATLVCGTLLAANFALSLVFLWVSSHNYPGGAAFAKLHELVQEEGVRVHIDVASAMTGVSRFGTTTAVCLSFFISAGSLAYVYLHMCVWGVEVEGESEGKS